MADQRRGTLATEDLLQLRRWARVALAARAALRVQDVAFAWGGSFAPGTRSDTTEAIAIATDSAKAARADVPRYLKWHDRYKVLPTADGSARAAARAAECAADAAFAAETVMYLSEMVLPVALACDAAGESLMQGLAISSDYRRLLALSQAERWTDDTPVDSDRLGPLWPFGKPKDWPTDPQAHEHPPVMRLDLVIPADMTDQQFTEFEVRVSHFLGSLSRLHAAVGGAGLRVLEEGSGETDTAEDQAPIDCDQTPVGTGATGGGR